ncbi:MAG: sigma-70 family RNA polymerase sigma factor [Clostridia bacterium]|nr:sigma-70 family RNA polymerase sigma factor [Clostridia bacterium]
MDNGASSYRRFLDGDDNGIVEIIKEYKYGLTLFLNEYLNNITEAEDAMEDTFFVLVAKKPKFNGKSTFRSWLYSIGRNIAVDRIRRSAKNPSIPVDALEDTLAEEKTVEETYLEQERKLMLHKIMKRLNADYRRVLYLAYFEDFDNAQTAKTMGKSKRQIENLLYHAKSALKKELEKEGFDYENR